MTRVKPRDPFWRVRRALRQQRIKNKKREHSRRACRGNR